MDADEDKPSALMRGLQSLYRTVLDWDSYLPWGKTSDPVAAHVPQDQVDNEIDSTIRSYVVMASSLGFVTNIGGLITLPISIPANLVGSAAIQMRMIQQIVRLYDLDPEDSAVMAFAIACLVGSEAIAIVDKALAPIAGKIAKNLIQAIPASVILAINRAIGFRLVTKFGTTGIVNLGRWIPLAGGLVCGAVDGYSTYAIGHAAKELLARYRRDGGGEAPGSNSGPDDLDPNSPIYAGGPAPEPISPSPATVGFDGFAPLRP